MLAIAVASASVAACADESGSSDSASVSNGEIVIGTVQPLTGPFKFYGDWQVPGLRAAVEKVNAEGGINGRKVRLEVADGGCTSGAQGVKAAREVINEKGAIALVGTQCGVVVSAINDTLLKGTKTINLSITGSGANSSADATDPAKVGYSFYYSPNTATQAVDALTWAYGDGKLNPKKVGILAGTDNYGTDALKGVDAFVEAKGLPKPVIQRIDQTATDASVQVAKLKDAGVDTVFCACYPPPTTALMREALQNDWHPNFLGALASSSYQVFEALPPAAYENFYGTTPSVLTRTSPEMQAQVEEYKEFDSGVTLDSVNGVGIAEVLFEYLRRAGDDLTPDSLVDALYSGPVDSQTMGETEIKQGAYPQVINAVTMIKYEKSGDTVEQVDVGRVSPDIDIPGIYKAG